VKRTLTCVLCLSLLAADNLFSKVGSHAAMYAGGTVGSIKQGTTGELATEDEKVLIFGYKGGKLSIPYDRINDLEYGQKAGRRLGLAIAVSPFFLLSKKRKHFLTIGYQDESDKQQAAIFELGKHTVRTTLASLEARSGRKVDYQDEEARRSGLGD